LAQKQLALVYALSGLNSCADLFGNQEMVKTIHPTIAT
jgi:hypothetical protein